MRIGVPRETRPGETRVAATPKTVEAARGARVRRVRGAGRRRAVELRRRRLPAAGADVIDEAVWNADVAQDQRARPTPRSRCCGRARSWCRCSRRPSTPSWWQALAARGSPRWRWMPCRASRGPSRSTCCRRWPTSVATGRWSRRPTSSARSSPGRSPRRARCRRPRCSSSAPGWPVWPRSARPARWARWCGRSTPAPRSASRSSRWVRSSCGSTSRRPGPSADGYAKETSDDFDAKAAELYAAQAADVDIVITTALIPGRPAPRLITEEMVASMKPGSVVVDMAAANGGNVAGTVADQKVVTDERRDDPGLHRPAGAPAHPGLPAVRHQPGQPAQAGHARARTASSPSTSRTRCSAA